MKKIVICHLYYDLMNLYGELGNIKALAQNFALQNLEVEVINVTINEPINFKDYDFIYIGSGTEEMRDLVLQDLLNYQEELKNYLKSGGFILATGNAYPLFGKSIINAKKEEIKALNLFSFKEEETSRIVKERTVKTDFLTNDLYAFENHLHKLDQDNDWFNDPEVFKHFYGTYLIGPILIRNPQLLEYLIKTWLETNKLPYQKLDLTLENQAYQEFITFKKIKNNKKAYLKKYKTGLN